MSPRVRRVSAEREAGALGDEDAGTGEHEVASEEREAGGGVCEEREAGERDEHVPLIGSRAP